MQLLPPMFEKLTRVRWKRIFLAKYYVSFIKKFQLFFKEYYKFYFQKQKTFVFLKSIIILYSVNCFHNVRSILPIHVSWRKTQNIQFIVLKQFSKEDNLVKE